MIKIKLLLSDVDGVMTDGSLIYNKNGEELKVFNVKDGLICSYLKAMNIKIGVITGRSSEIVMQRFSELSFDYIEQNISNKKDCFNKIIKLENLQSSEVAYIGDDTNDIELLSIVGISGCPQDATDEVKSEVDYVCVQNGGKGAFREFAEYILKLNNNA